MERCKFCWGWFSSLVGRLKNSFNLPIEKCRKIQFFIGNCQKNFRQECRWTFVWPRSSLHLVVSGFSLLLRHAPEADILKKLLTRFLSFLHSVCTISAFVSLRLSIPVRNLFRYYSCVPHLSTNQPGSKAHIFHLVFCDNIPEFFTFLLFSSNKIVRMCLEKTQGTKLFMAPL